jgi:hypothetical protein
VETDPRENGETLTQTASLTEELTAKFDSVMGRSPQDSEDAVLLNGNLLARFQRAFV